MAKAAAHQAFGKYQILERIATGGMAEIYKARLEGIGGFQRTFAIKRILPHLSANAEYIAMLVDEAKVAGLLSHANIVQILDLGQVDNIWYIAMEYVEGRDLGGILKRARERGLVLPVPHAVFTAIELLKGLEYAHQRQVMRGGRAVPLNIIHRDISPPNVLLAFQGEVKLTDFGIARASHKALETQSGIIKGRFDYMSPEQAAGAKDLDQRSDLFSVGVVLYEMLTSEHPFRDPTELGTLERIRTGKYTPVSQKNPDVPFTLETIVDRALRVDRNERFPSATAFKEALDKFFQDSGFIFNQGTLAAYVRGLFPEVGKGGAAASSGPSTSPAPPAKKETVLKERPRAAEPDDVILEDEPDGPTRIIDARVMDEERPTVAQNPDMGLAPRSDDTVIRSPAPKNLRPTVPFPAVPVAPREPFPASGDGPTKVSLDDRGFGGDDETQIRKNPFAEAGVSLPPPLPFAAETVTIPLKTPPPKPRPVEVAPQRSALGLLTFVLCAASFAIGLLLGTAGTVVALQLIGPVLVGRSDASSATGVIEVQAPATAVVTVNGAPYTGPVAVPANVPQSVQIAFSGTGGAAAHTWDRQVTVSGGETRVISLQPETP